MPVIRQQISIAATPRTVWRCLTTAEGLASWWVDEARVDARAGGRIVLVSEDDDGAPMEECGVFLEVRPTRNLEIAWDSAGKALTKGTQVQFRLAKDKDETRLLVTHSGGKALDDPESFEQIDKAWRAALKALRSHLES